MIFSRFALKKRPVWTAQMPVLALQIGQNQRLGPFGARWITIKKNGLPAQCEEASREVGSGGMGDTGIEPVTISL